jgi:hypothetical protein
LTSTERFAIVAFVRAHTILGRSALGIAIYSLCVVFVCSFILFEVLDVDGSDFPSAATQAVAAETPHADARRLHMDAVRDIVVPPISPALCEPLRAVIASYDIAGVPPVPVPPGSQHRQLPRASLSDIPPSA